MDGETRKSRLCGLLDPICLLFMDTVHESCACTVYSYHSRGQKTHKTCPNLCVITCQCVALNSAAQSKARSYVSFWLTPWSPKKTYFASVLPFSTISVTLC